MATDHRPAPEAVTKLVQQVTKLDEQISGLQAQRAGLVDTIATLVTEHGTYAAGDAQVIVKPGGRQLDKAAFRAAYPADVHPELYKSEPDTTAIKHELGTKVLGEFYGAPGRTQVVVK